MTISKEIARNLLQIKAIKLNPQNPFTWASGIRSPIYCDNRITLSYPEVRTTIKKALGSIAGDFGSYDYIAGVATAGIPHGALLADYLKKPFIYVRSEAKSHGRQNKIEGEANSGAKALVIEDLISTGGSSIQAAQVLQDAGIEVVGVLAIFDYQFQVAIDNFKAASLGFKTLSNYTALIDEALLTNYISPEDKTLLDSWNADPTEWFNNVFNS